MSFHSLRTFPLVLALFTLVHAGEAAAPKDFKPGGKDSVKDWKPRDYSAVEAGKTGYTPVCVYIYDMAPKRNSMAFHFEEKEVLSNPEVKDKLAKFIKIRMKNDGKDAKGWPEAMLKGAENGATLVLMSADMTMVITFDKSKDANERSGKMIAAAAASIQVYDDKRKETNAKAEKEKEAKAAKDAEAAAAARKEKEKQEEPGFSIDIKKPDPKPVAAKKSDKKTADKKADPKPPDPKPVDPKAADPKDPKKDPKKTPEEE